MNKQERQLRIRFTNLTSFLGLCILCVIYVIAMRGQVSAYNLQIIINQIVITAVVATGAIFIFTIGAFDISLGSATAVSAISGVLVYNHTESIWLMFVSCVLVGMLIGLTSSSLAAIFHLPPFVTTIAMLSILNSLIEVLLNGQPNVGIPREVASSYDTVAVKLGVLLGFFLICYIIFDWLPIGRKAKFLGGNPVCAKQTGLNAGKLSIIAFVIAGVGVGLGAILTILRAPTLSRTTASSVGMDVLMALAFGGMPLSGGAKSRIYCALIGASSIVLFDQILLTFGLSSGPIQIAKALFFLAIVAIAFISNRQKTLPR